MNKKILASIFVIGMLALAMGWGTYSYFSDTETSSGNKFTAGTLDLKVNGNDDPLVAVITVENVEPGDFGSKVITLKNEGTLDGIAKLHIKNVVNSAGATPEPEPTPDDGELGEKLLVTIKYDSTVIVSGKTLNELNSIVYALGALGAGAEKDVTVFWWVPSDVGNEIMGDIVTFDIEFLLEKPPTVREGAPINAIAGFGVRYRSFANTGGREVYLGVDDLGIGSNRVEKDLTWQSNNNITFTYDKLADKLITTVDAGKDGTIDVTLEYPNVASKVQSVTGKLITDVDFLVINVVCRHSDTKVDFNNVKLDGYSLGNFHAEYSQWKTWTVTDLDFSQSFTISGDIVLTGTFSGGEEWSKVELMVSFYP
jgi:predicted ribosomally synthesized peptide with SipW-like signal peptide